MTRLISVLFLTFFSLSAFADSMDPAPVCPEPTYANDHELSPENYQLLGKLVWEQIQKNPRLDKRELSDSDIHNMIDAMERNRDEITLTLNDLSAVINRSCPGAASPGVKLDKLGFKLKELFK